MRRMYSFVFVLFLSALVAACGGGGGGAPTPAPAPANRAPVAGLLASGDLRTEGGQLRASVGSPIRLDASGSTDADGDALSYQWSLAVAPPASHVATTGASRELTWIPDVLGTYTFRLTVTDPKGATGTQQASVIVDNTPPTAAVSTAQVMRVFDAGESIFATSVGYDVVLDGGPSSDADGDTLTRSWALTSRPAGSLAQLGTASGAINTLTPDLLGDYTAVLTTTDPRGAQSTYKAIVRANNRRPVAQITTNATPRSLPSAASVTLPRGTEVTLRGDASTDADGDAISYAWTIDAKPAGSGATLSSGTAANPVFIADVEGTFTFRLRVTDTAGAFSERTLNVQVGTHAPVAVVDRSRVSTVAGTAVRASAALSFDEDGDPLTYQWSVDARPAGSTASIGAAGTATISFVPDLPGTYVLAARVDDGHASSIANVTVRAHPQFGAPVPLGFVPGEAKYSTGLDRMVVASANPSALRLVDAFTGAVISAALPLDARRLQLSPDGTLAVVLHDGAFSLVDLQGPAVLRTTASQGMQTDAFVTNAGMVYLIGTQGPQFSANSVTVFNGRTGERLAQPAFGGSAAFYSAQRGILAGSLNKAFFIPEGLSPADISFFTIDPATRLVNGSGDSPYHGEYAMGSPLYLSDDERLLFTYYGTYFSTSSLQYAGSLAGVRTLLGFSRSAAGQEALALPGMPSSSPAYPYPPDYPAVYKRYTGDLLLPDADLPLPTIGGQQSYGRGIFHSGNGSHILLVQTGTAAADGVGASYFVIAR